MLEHMTAINGLDCPVVDRKSRGGIAEFDLMQPRKTNEAKLRFVDEAGPEKRFWGERQFGQS
jgi:hypothetical protein